MHHCWTGIGNLCHIFGSFLSINMIWTIMCLLHTKMGTEWFAISQNGELFLSFLHICIAVEDPSTGKCWNPINRFSQPHCCPCRKLGHGFWSACCGLFCVQSVKMRGDCWYWGNCWPSLFKLYLHNFSTYLQV